VEQVWDYGLDLKNFHETSHKHLIAPILIATNAKKVLPVLYPMTHDDNLLFPINSNVDTLSTVIDEALKLADGEKINAEDWLDGRYAPTPTIIEATMALYKGHSVAEISRRDASAKNLSVTSQTIGDIIAFSEKNNHRAICFVTGVPGAGKTLVGLNVAAKHF